MCVLIFSTTFVWKKFSWKKKIRWDIKMYNNGLNVKYPLFLSNFNETRIFSTVYWKTLKYQISWKSVSWQPNYSMRIDKRTWRS
jgi:hypothetical protein